jgi:hypothetical protein
MTTGTLWREEGWPDNVPLHPPLVTLNNDKYPFDGRVQAAC